MRWILLSIELVGCRKLQQSPLLSRKESSHESEMDQTFSIVNAIRQRYVKIFEILSKILRRMSLFGAHIGLDDTEKYF